MKNTKVITHSAIIAALYVVLTYVSGALGLSSGILQCRLSEVMCVLPLLTKAAIPGLFAGCFAANLLTGALLPDCVFGSLATLVGAVGTYILKEKLKNPAVAALPSVVSNAVVVPLILKYAYGAEYGLLLMVVSVTAGEILSACLFGSLFFTAFKKIFK